MKKKTAHDQKTKTTDEVFFFSLSFFFSILQKNKQLYSFQVAEKIGLEPSEGIFGFTPFAEVN